MTAGVTTVQAQVWIGLAVGFGTALTGILRYFDVRSKHERSTAAGQAFESTVDALASSDSARQLAGAILLRRFFDRATEQGSRDAPYAKEALSVIAAILRETPAGNVQKLLADGLAYAPSLRHADLQHCNLHDAYLGARDDRSPDLSHADFFEADLTGASLRGVTGHQTVFFRATMLNTVLEESDLTGADFRSADLTGARFAGATIAGARFAGAKNIPEEIAALLNDAASVPMGSSAPVVAGSS
jgi:hypothetical protein